MSYALVQGTNQISSLSPATITYATTPVQGNLLILTIIERGSVAAITSVQDGNGNNLTLLNSIARGPSFAIYQYAMIATASQSTSLVVTSSAVNFSLNNYEFSGNPSSIAGIIDNAQATATESAGTLSQSTNTLQPSVTSTNANDLLLTTIGWGSGAVINSPSWTTSGGATVNPLTLNNSSAANRLFDGYAIETTTGTFNPYATWFTSQNWAQLTTILKPATVVPPPPNSTGGSTMLLMGV